MPNKKAQAQQFLTGNKLDPALVGKNIKFTQDYADGHYQTPLNIPEGSRGVIAGVNPHENHVQVNTPARGYPKTVLYFFSDGRTPRIVDFLTLTD